MDWGLPRGRKKGEGDMVRMTLPLFGPSDTNWEEHPSFGQNLYLLLKQAVRWTGTNNQTHNSCTTKYNNETEKLSWKQTDRTPVKKKTCRHSHENPKPDQQACWSRFGFFNVNVCKIIRTVQCYNVYHSCKYTYRGSSYDWTQTYTNSQQMYHKI